jgi:hypothetical protein
MSLALGSVDVPAPRLVTRPAKLDFAANPNHYCANGSGKVKKAKPRQGPQVDLSPRLELRLTVQCDAAEEQDAEMEWWLSVMR